MIELFNTKKISDSKYKIIPILLIISGGRVWVWLESFCNVLYCRIEGRQGATLLDISRTNSFHFQSINICYQNFSSSKVYHYTFRASELQTLDVFTNKMRDLRSGKSFLLDH